jgi:integrase
MTGFSPHRGSSVVNPFVTRGFGEKLSIAGRNAGIGHLSSHTFRNAYRTWLDAMGTPVGVQQKMMRHADIRTTMNHYGTALKADMRKASDAVGQVSAGFKAS